MYEGKKTISALGLKYIKIHACLYHCIFYRKECASLSICPACSESRWKRKDGSVAAYRKGVPAKALQYFPLIPRFRCVFQSSQTDKDLTWHVNEWELNSKLRHLTKFSAWKLVDENGLSLYWSLEICVLTYQCWRI